MWHCSWIPVAVQLITSCAALAPREGEHGETCIIHVYRWQHLIDSIVSSSAELQDALTSHWIELDQSSICSIHFTAFVAVTLSGFESKIALMKQGTRSGVQTACVTPALTAFITFLSYFRVSYFTVPAQGFAVCALQVYNCVIHLVTSPWFPIITVMNPLLLCNHCCNSCCRAVKWLSLKIGVRCSSTLSLWQRSGILKWFHHMMARWPNASSMTTSVTRW